MITFPCQTEESPVGPVLRAYAPVRIKTQPPKPESGPPPDPEWIAFDFLVNPGYDVTLVPRQVGESLLLRRESGDKTVTLTWRGGSIKALLKTVTMEIEDKRPFKATLAWALETDDVPLVLGQQDVFSKVYDVDFSILKGKVRFSMQGSEYDRILERINEANPRLKKFQVDDPKLSHTMQFIDVDAVCFVERIKLEPPRPTAGRRPAAAADTPYGTRFTTVDGKHYFSEIALWELEELLRDNPAWFRSHKSVFMNLRRVLKVKKEDEGSILFEGQTDFRDDLVSEERLTELKRRLREIV